MNRKYDREWYMDRVAAIRRIIPDCGLSTDIFSGFHSETEEDHQLSLSLMEECGYDSAFMFKYSERPGTHASKYLPDDVPEEVKIRRLNEIIALQNRLSAEANARCVGKTYEVLVKVFPNVVVTSCSAVRNKTVWWCLTVARTVWAIL